MEDQAEQHQKWWQQIKQHPYATGILVLLVLILFIFLAYWFGWDWTGFNMRFYNCSHRKKHFANTTGREKAVGKSSKYRRAKTTINKPLSSFWSGCEHFCRGYAQLVIFLPKIERNCA
jgi:hypothetical protein